ncbi:MAG: class I SAM-dependent methyltransferase [Scytonematopsis contorta HA4267-MV1]|jgi:SAM-dependent methyltransferase|nr:class I SAM-dependent methyltransferase [Scytonematopsis contorta HA4267-MV1]
MMNYFASNSAAERYAKGRPYFHPMIVGHIKEFMKLTKPLSSVLDVGCGTGLSTIALKEIAQNIIAVDASFEMIALAPKENRIKYVVAPAENLPFEENEFDLITLSQVFHWLNRDKFLSKANKILRSNGWLITYDNYFLGQMVKNPEFHKWFKEEYLVRYSSPPRGKLTFTAENTHPYGFRLIKEVQYENNITFSLEGLVDYLVTQSNVIAVVEGGRENIEEARNWLTGVIKPMFINPKEEEFLFSVFMWYLQCF